MGNYTGSQTGNGREAPFGNGQGGAASGGSSGGMDLVKDPMARLGGPGKDLVRDPEAMTIGKTAGRNPQTDDPPGVQNMRSQQSGQAADLRQDSVPAGGTGIYGNQSPNPQRKSMMGVGSIGDSRKPFKLKGESAPAGSMPDDGTSDE
jgi:hypothetical protein